MFESVLGHSLQKEILRTALTEGRLSHAYIFSGKEGIGKTSLALEFAKAIVCSHQTACGNCPACKQFFSTADVQILEGEKSISVDEIRAITTDIYLRPFILPKKIYLIKHAEKMTVQAQNALLKVLEEPPAYAVLLLVTSNRSLLLPTILSRGVELRFQPLGSSQLKLWFQREGKPIPSDDLLALANGSVTEALELCESEEFHLLQQSVTRAVKEFLFRGTTKEMLLLYQQFLTYKDRVSQLLELMFYELKISAEGGTLPLQTVTAIHGELCAVSARLSANGAYAVTVLGALLRIRNHLNKERIS